MRLPSKPRMGHVHLLRDFPSRAEGDVRTVRVFTPDGYDAGGDHRYPVLYMQDGQNVFSHPESARLDTWCANVTLERLAAEGAVEPWIIVAVDSGLGRFSDYSPWVHRGREGNGERYARFLVDELKPWVDATYRTRAGSRWTAVMGSSLGGLISLYLGLSRPGTFGRVGALSPTVMWAHDALFRAWTAHTRRWTRIYLDAGHPEHLHVEGESLPYGEGACAFYEHLKGLGYHDHELFLVLEQGGGHHERDWQRRLPLAFRWLLG